ncbi:MAG: UDP-GlcNAc:undecaprenyl-phosphate GlcNAc-1-phosphate transferase [Paracoccaceae bacterium]|jgi:UDP-GlcNAc:undecaprenyl-phosphate GlcNAc-1-phosphate transferase
MMGFLIALLAAAVATAILSHLALRIGWIDQRDGQEYRKLRTQPVALVGGAAILVGVVVAVGLLSASDQAPISSLGSWLAAVAWPGLMAAFLLGLFDDLAPAGLSARVKFGGQLLVAALVALYPGSAVGDVTALECLGLGLLALVAMNAVNLFDHADGLVGLLTAFAMLAGSGPLARIFGGAAIGYLPFNLFLRRSPSEVPMDVGQERSRRVPYAMLGDSGSHLLGVLIATTPGAWWFLALPVLDMVRVVVGRLRRGSPFWRGDRTHVGHLLHDIGFSPVTAAILVGTALVPPLVAIALMDGPAPLIVGLLAGTTLYFGMLVMVDSALPGGVPDLGGEDPFDRDDFRGDDFGGDDFDRDGSEGGVADAAVSEVFARASGVDQGRPGSDVRREGAGSGPGSEDPSGPFAAPSAGASGGTNQEPTQ